MLHLFQYFFGKKKSGALNLNYPFNDGTGTQVSDVGPGTHHGTLIGDDGTNFWQ